MSKVDKYIEDAISNINNDREITRELLDDAIKWLAKDEARHREVGMVMAKYVETLQRSNEQLVKIIGVINKNPSSNTLSQDDKDEIFDMLQKEEEADES
mgnify:CR=1 FL=1